MIVAMLLACGGGSSTPEPAAPPSEPAVITKAEPDCEGRDACRAACVDGDALACNALALIVHDGRAGAKRDPARAARLYEQACDGGAGVGCYNLSHMAANGDGIPEDSQKAARLLARTHRLYETSCAAGGLTWCTNLAGLVQRGEGRDPDQDGARTLYMDTCERGEPTACLELAYMVREGHGGAPDPAAARAILQKTCDSGSGEACNNLALQVEEEGGDALPLFEAACDAGVAMACRNLAVRSPEEARLPLLEKACDDPDELDPLACAIAAQMLLQQPLPDSRRAGQYLVRACSVGLKDACMPAVQLGAEGRFELSPAEARGLLERGCRLGDPTACQVLQAPAGASAPN